MIRDLIIGGNYKDEHLNIDAILVNPAEHDRDDNVLLFEIRITTPDIPVLKINEWVFYLMDGNNRIYNAIDYTELPRDDISKMTVIAAYNFRPEFLYNEIRIGFLYKEYACIEFFEIGH